MRKTQLAVGGMACAQRCAPRVRAALEAVPGVDRAVVDFQAASAEVVAAAAVDPAALSQAVASLGMTATPAPASAPSDAPCDASPSPAERTALCSIYDSCSGQAWHRRSGWRSEAPLSEWAGVVVRSELLVELCMPVNNLVGELPACIGKCTELRLLNLVRNKLSGPLPASLGRLRHLMRMWVFDNAELSGDVPATLATCNQLTVLDVRGTGLTIPAALREEQAVREARARPRLQIITSA